MSEWSAIGRALVVVGSVAVIMGLIFVFHDRIPFLGKLPGDFFVKKNNTTFYFPLTTMLIISVILTILLNLFGRSK
ncbi:MAG: DUF2905 domain-containing protein [candidate division Zixibacteria bacterium]|jgi:hypothetical protein|nr:DUF2905 domain-containing protein [candidate division Zixibacteria bacterium]